MFFPKATHVRNARLCLVLFASATSELQVGEVRQYHSLSSESIITHRRISLSEPVLEVQVSLQGSVPSKW